jgi:hypothetical protein
LIIFGKKLKKSKFAVTEQGRFRIRPQVMIMERMDESLVLLADLMCWPLQKVSSLLVNGRQIERRVRISVTRFVKILFLE